MKTFTQFILEKELDENFTLDSHDGTQSDYNQWLKDNTDIIWNLLQTAYVPKGGYLGLKSRRDLKKKITLVKAVYYKGIMVAVAVYNPYIPELKCVGITSISNQYHKQGVAGVKLIMRDDVENWDKFTFIEADYDMERICKEVGAYNLPNCYAIELIKKELDLWDDGYHYNRQLQDKKIVTKTIFGIPNQEILDKTKNNHDESFRSFLEVFENKKVVIDYTKFYEGMTDWDHISEIDCACSIVLCFYNHYFDDGVCEYEQDLLDKFHFYFNELKRLYKAKQYNPKYKRLYPDAIECGKKLLSILTEYKLNIISLDD